MQKTKKYYYNELYCNKYVTNTTKLNELNEYFRNYLENVSMRNTLLGLRHKQVLPRITWLPILLWKVDNSADIQYQMYLADVFPLNFTIANIETGLLIKKL